MGHVEFGVEPDGLAVVVDGFLQSGLVLRGDAERVPGRGPLGVTVEGLPVISDRLGQGATTGRALAGAPCQPGSSRPPRPAGPLRAGRDRASGGPGEIGIDTQGLPVVVDAPRRCTPEPAWISPRLKCAGANRGSICKASRYMYSATGQSPLVFRARPRLLKPGANWGSFFTT